MGLATGMKKLVVNHLEKILVTSDCATIVKELEVGKPPAFASDLLTPVPLLRPTNRCHHAAGATPGRTDPGPGGHHAGV
jgi:hypothetical protein